MERKIDIPELKSLLKNLRMEIERKQKGVGERKKSRKNRHPGIWRQLWPEIKRNNLVSRKIELDTRLQVELGKKFSDYLRPDGVRLETIARLILLAYWAGELCEMEGEVTRTLYTNRELTVRNIREKLREKGLHKAESFRPEMAKDLHWEGNPDTPYLSDIKIRKV